MDPDTHFNRIKSQLIVTLKKESKGRSVKVQTTTWIRFKQDEELVELAFNSRMTDVHNLSEVEEIVDEMINHMKEQVENLALLNSRFVFDEFLFMNIDFHQLNLTRGSSYIPLPQWLDNKKAIINPCNEDQECFKWAVIAASRWEEIGKNPQRISNLKKSEKDFDWSGIKFPVSVKDTKGFEIKNRISINLLAIEDRDIYICRKGGNYERAINLMIIDNHYVAIKSLSRLLSSKNSKHKGKEFFCMNCLEGFQQEISRDEYMRYCLDNETVKVEMPHKKPIAEFCNEQCQFKVPFIMYADFESLLEPIQEPSKDSSGPWTTVTNNHIPSGWCVYSEFAYGVVQNPLTLYCGKDCVKKFCDHITGEAHRLYHAFPEGPMKPLTSNQNERYKKSKRCHICFRPFTEKNPKVRDHCHYTGNYRGATHRNCNLQYKIPSHIPIVFHNLSGYDAHLFIRELAAFKPGGGAKMEVIAKNKEDYITFSIKVVIDKYVDKNGVEKEKEI